MFVKQLLTGHTFFGIPKSSSQCFILCASLLLDSLWHLRNEVVHNHVPPDTGVLISTVRRRFGEHDSASDVSSVSSGCG